METYIPIIGWTIIMKKLKLDLDKIDFEDFTSDDVSSLYTEYYLGKHGRKFPRPPQNPDVLFKTKESAVSHIDKTIQNADEYTISVVPVYKKPIATLHHVEIKKWVRPQETLEFRSRQRQVAMRKDGFKKYDKEAGKIKKLR